MTGGLLATVGILAALQARERTGRGQVVDASLFEGALALMTLPAARLLAGGSVVNELTGTHACYRVFRCRDGKHLAVGALEPKFWEALCDALELGDLLARQWEGGKRREETLGRVAAAFAERDRDDWVEALRAARRLRRAGAGPGRGPRARARGRAPAGRRAAGGRARDAHPGLARSALGHPATVRGRRRPSAPTRTRSCARQASPSRRSRGFARQGSSSERRVRRVRPGEVRPSRVAAGAATVPAGTRAFRRERGDDGVLVAHPRRARARRSTPSARR